MSEIYGIAAYIALVIIIFAVTETAKAICRNSRK